MLLVGIHSPSFLAIHTDDVSFTCTDNIDQSHSQITHFSKQSMQGGLINDRARQEGVPVVLPGDGQAAKPVCPLRPEVTLDPDLIDDWLAWIRSRVKRLRHCFALFVAGHVGHGARPVHANISSIGYLSIDTKVLFWGYHYEVPRGRKLLRGRLQQTQFAGACHSFGAPL